MRITGVVTWGLTVAALLVPAAASASQTGADFDNDGRDDLAIGILGDGEGGAVQVVYGSRNGLSAKDKIFTQDTAGMSESVDGNDGFGAALAAGDFNGDGYDDLAISAPFEVIDGVLGAGVVHVIYGSRNGLTTKRDDLFVHGLNGLGVPPGTADGMGWALAAGDFGKNANDDLAIASNGRDVGGNDRAGMVEVLYGKGSGLTAKGESRLTQDTPQVDEEAEPGDVFGFTLAAGDFGKDRKDDLAVGARGESVGSESSAGSVSVFYSSKGKIRGKGSDYLDQNVLHDPNPGADAVAEEDDRFGSFLAAGDFGRGKRDDLAITAPTETLNGVAYPNAGMISVAYGKSPGLKTGAANTQLIIERSVTGCYCSAAQTGSGLGAGNFGKSKHDELVFGIPGHDGDGEDDAGAVGVIYGRPGGLPDKALDNGELWSQDTPGIEEVGDTGDFFGLSLATGSFDGRGPSDLAIGAPLENVLPDGFARGDGPGPIKAGAVNVIRGTASGLTPAGDKLLIQGRNGLGGTPELYDFFGVALASTASGPTFD